MPDLFDVLRDQVDNAPDLLREKLAAHLKLLCRAINGSSTSSVSDATLLGLKTTIETTAAAVRRAFHPRLNWVDGLNLRPFVPYYSTAHGTAFNDDSMKVLKALPRSYFQNLWTAVTG